MLRKRLDSNTVIGNPFTALPLLPWPLAAFTAARANRLTLELTDRGSGSAINYAQLPVATPKRPELLRLTGRPDSAAANGNVGR